MANKRTTQRDIARELDISIQAVSLALRNHRSISEALRKRVHAKAVEMEYVIDPALKSLSAYRTRSQTKDRRWTTLALIHDWDSEEHWHRNGYAQSFTKLLNAAANRQGYKIEENWLGHHSAAAEQCYRKLHNRGIVGLIVAPLCPDLNPTAIEPPKEHFQVVTCGPEHLYRNFLTVQLDYYENLRIAWAALRQKGYQRIGLVSQQIHGWRTGEAWRAAYHIEKELAKHDPLDLVPFEITGESYKSQQAFNQWVAQQQPDAIITSCYHVFGWAAALDPKLFVAEMNPRAPGRPGINLNLHQLTEALVDMLTMAMQRSLTFDQTFPYRVHIQGQWQDG